MLGNTNLRASSPARILQSGELAKDILFSNIGSGVKEAEVGGLCEDFAQGMKQLEPVAVHKEEQPLGLMHGKTNK